VTGPPSHLTFVVAPSTVATNGQRLSQLPVVQLTDGFGNPVKLAGQVVQITQVPNTGAGTLQILNDTTRTDANGVATFTGTQLNCPVGDSYRIAFATPTTSKLESAPISVRRGQPSALTILVPADGATRGSTFSVQPVIRSVDAGGNPVPAGDCINVRIQPPEVLTGSTQVTGVGDTFMFNSVGVDATTPPGIYTL